MTPTLFCIAAPKLAAAAARIEPFDVILRDFRYFVHKRSATLWLHPEPSRPDALAELQAALQAAVPHADQQSAGFGGAFTPHVTVAHCASEAEAQAAHEVIVSSACWPAEGVRFRVSEVFIMARDGPDDQFAPRWRIPLGCEGGGVAIGPLPREQRFLHMPRAMPDFCARPKKKNDGARSKRRAQARASTTSVQGQRASTAASSNVSAKQDPKA